MNTKKLFLIIGLVISSWISVYSNPSFPTPGEISVCASSPIPDGINPTSAAYQDIVDCGFNLVMNSGSVDYFKKQFSLMGNLPLRYLVASPDLFQKKETYIRALASNRHFAGWKLKDEPKFSDIESLARQYKEMAKADSKNLVYINLVGVLESNFTGNSKAFSKYLELIQEKIGPQIWSYDYYPILIKNGKLSVNYDQFYSDLEDFRTISQKTQRPFWAYCESMAYKARSYSRPEATEAYLRWEAFSALAYGAQGIVYWTYGQRKSNSVENYTSALVNLDGKKSKAWYAAKAVNGEIKKFNHVFYQCNVKDVRHTGSKVYPGTRKLTGEFGPFKSVKSGNSGVMVSLIENGGKEYMVVVSRDVVKSQNVTIELSPNKSVTDLTLSSPANYDSSAEINFSLPAGSYKIFRVN